MNKNLDKVWNYKPDIPLANPSLFRTSLSLGLILSWFFKNWISFSEKIFLLIVAVICWALIYPDLEKAKIFEFNWVFQIWLANFTIMVFFTGSLHLYFYTFKKQANKLKFDHRSLTKKSWLYSFSNQVHDNIFWSLTSGVAQLTAFQAVTYWLMANGISPCFKKISDYPLWFPILFVLLPIWSAFHFYWIHRLLHIPILYKYVHSLHHRNVNVGPWSGLSMHPIEHFLYISSLCLHWILLSHPLHVIFHVLYLGPGAAMTHCGYESLLVKDKKRLELGTFYHQLHHRYYECNYGNQEMPWDRWFGTFHDGSEACTKKIREIKKSMHY